MRNIIFKRLLLCQKGNIRSIIDRSKRCSVKFCEERVWKNFNESVTQFVIHQRTICAGLSKKAFDVVFQSIPSKRSKQHPRRICDRLRSIELEPSKHRPINIGYQILWTGNAAFGNGWYKPHLAFPFLFSFNNRRIANRNEDSRSNFEIASHKQAKICRLPLSKKILPRLKREKVLTKLN